MKFGIFGAGAIGSYLGFGLAKAGFKVSLYTRGPHLTAIKKYGLKLERAGMREVVQVIASDNTEDLGEQDFLFLTVKAHSLPSIVSKIEPLLSKNTIVVTAMNGIPHWFFYGQKKRSIYGYQIEAVDPAGQVSRVLTPERIIGSVVYPACEVTEPGIVKHIYGNRFSLGEPSGEKTDRIISLSRFLISAGFRAPIRTRIRDEIWMKLWGNLAFNPISVLTGATLEQICSYQPTRLLARSMMEEAQQIGKILGVKFPLSIEERIEGAAAVGAHKTSMLQDFERGRIIEIDAIMTAVRDLGIILRVSTPTIDHVLGLVQQKAALAGCYVYPADR